MIETTSAIRSNVRFAGLECGETTSNPSSEELPRLFALAWAEFKAGIAFLGTIDGIHDTPEPPRWFITEALGHGVPYIRPSLLDTLRELAEWTFINIDAPRPAETAVMPAGESFNILVANFWSRWS